MGMGASLTVKASSLQEVVSPEILVKILKTIPNDGSLLKAGNLNHFFQACSETVFKDKSKEQLADNPLPTGSKTPWRFSYFARIFLRKGIDFSYKDYNYFKRAQQFFEGYDSYLNYYFQYIASNSTDKNALSKYLAARKELDKINDSTVDEVDFTFCLDVYKLFPADYKMPAIDENDFIFYANLPKLFRLTNQVPYQEKSIKDQLLQKMENLAPSRICSYYIFSLDPEKTADLYYHYGLKLKEDKNWQAAEARFLKADEYLSRQIIDLRKQLESKEKNIDKSVTEAELGRVCGKSWDVNSEIHSLRIYLNFGLYHQYIAKNQSDS